MVLVYQVDLQSAVIFFERSAKRLLAARDRNGRNMISSPPNIRLTRYFVPRYRCFGLRLVSPGHPVFPGFVREGKADVVLRKGKCMPNSVDQRPDKASAEGTISVTEVYTLKEVRRRLGWTDSSLRSAKRHGLQLLSCGKRKYVAGQDVLDFLRRKHASRLVATD
jgi:hypothetical protein